MNQMVIGLVNPEFGAADTDDGLAGLDPIESTVRESPPWVHVQDVFAYLDGSEIRHGLAATAEEVSTDEIFVDPDDGIAVDDTQTIERRYTNFLADVQNGFVCVDSSDGEFLFNALNGLASIGVVRAQIDVPRFGEHIEEQNGEIWQVGWKDEDDDGETIDAGVSYHRSAEQRDPTATNLTQLGFTYTFGGDLVRGQIAQSGYAAVYGIGNEDRLGGWFVNELLPYTHFPQPDDAADEDDAPDPAQDDAFDDAAGPLDDRDQEGSA